MADLLRAAIQQSYSVGPENRAKGRRSTALCEYETSRLNGPPSISGPRGSRFDYCQAHHVLYSEGRERPFARGDLTTVLTAVQARTHWTVPNLPSVPPALTGRVLIGELPDRGCQRFGRLDLRQVTCLAEQHKASTRDGCCVGPPVLGGGDPVRLTPDNQWRDGDPGQSRRQPGITHRLPGVDSERSPALCPHRLTGDPGG